MSFDSLPELPVSIIWDALNSSHFRFKKDRTNLVQSSHALASIFGPFVEKVMIPCRALEDERSSVILAHVGPALARADLGGFGTATSACRASRMTWGPPPRGSATPSWVPCRRRCGRWKSPSASSSERTDRLRIGHSGENVNHTTLLPMLLILILILILLALILM